MKKLLYVIWFLGMAGIGVVLGCFIHATRVNQTTLMSGVAFVRELPYGEQIVGLIETTVFSYQEKKELERYREEHAGKIQIDPEVLKKHKDLYRESHPVQPK
ncbi:MAG: hypothetical protein ACP5M0_13215 [Desulfomonilaceae bacterium]